MKNLKPLFLIIAFCLWSGAVFAGLDEGKAAYKNGDYSLALTELLPLANSGDAEAQYILGRMYEHGQGVVEAPKGAAYWYGKAAEHHNASTMLSLSDAYASGKGVEKNTFFSTVLLLKAARQKNIPAMYRVIKAKIWFYYTDSKEVERSVFDHIKERQMLFYKSEDAIREELHEIISKGKVMVATLLLLAAKNGDTLAISEREEIFSHMPIEDVMKARELIKNTPPEDLLLTFDLDDPLSVSSQIHRAFEVHP